MERMYETYDCGCCPCCGCTCDDWGDEREDEQEDDFIAPTYTVAADYDPIEGVFYEVEPDKLPSFDCGGESMTYEMVDGINTTFDARGLLPVHETGTPPNQLSRAWAILKAAVANKTKGRL